MRPTQRDESDLANALDNARLQLGRIDTFHHGISEGFLDYASEMAFDLTSAEVHRLELEMAANLANDPEGGDGTENIEKDSGHATGPAQPDLPSAETVAADAPAAPEARPFQPAPDSAQALAPEGPPSAAGDQSPAAVAEMQRADATPSIYDARYRPVAGLPGHAPAGGYANLTLARDLPPLPNEFTPTTPDGRAGSGVPYRDQDGQVYYRTFDADGAEVGWVSAPVDVARLEPVLVTGQRSSEAGASAGGAVNAADQLAGVGTIPLLVRLAPVAEGMLAAELSYGPPPLKAIAAGTLATGAAMAAWQMNNRAGPQRDMLDPQAQEEARAPLINVPAAPPPPMEGLVPPPQDDGSAALPGPALDGPKLPIVETLPVADPLTIDDQVVTRNPGDARRLAENLTHAGLPQPGAGYQPHHIVPVDAGGPAMNAVREKLQALGININDAVNGAWLPGPKADADAPGAYHPRLNNDMYNGAIIAEFSRVITREDAIGVLSDIKTQLQEGDFPGVRPRPQPKGNQR